jgi:hypothetical protein
MSSTPAGGVVPSAAMDSMNNEAQQGKKEREKKSKA